MPSAKWMQLLRLQEMPCLQGLPLHRSHRQAPRLMNILIQGFLNSSRTVIEREVVPRGQSRTIIFMSTQIGLFALNSILMVPLPPNVSRKKKLLEYGRVHHSAHLQVHRLVLHPVRHQIFSRVLCPSQVTSVI